MIWLAYAPDVICSLNKPEFHLSSQQYTWLSGFFHNFIYDLSLLEFTSQIPFHFSLPIFIGTESKFIH